MKTKLAIFAKVKTRGDSARATIVKAIEDDGAFDVCEFEDASEIDSSFDKLLVFGGDGTMLEAVRAIGEKDISVLGVNLGNLGFLAEFERTTDASEIIDALKCGATKEKLLLSVNLNGKILARALNEVVIKSSTTRPIFIDLYVDDNYVDSYHSDGAIISSPTGSTAYSLSAGGPILSPDVSAFVVNPICAHSLHSRPLVISSSSRVTLKLSGDENASACIDGGAVFDLPRDSAITVQKASNGVRFITKGDDDFYKKLFQKMNRWGTTHTTSSNR